MELATRRLIDASATLPPADRALLSLWTQRGLDDAAVARMTGMSPEAIVTRRERIISALSEELGLPPEDISGALRGIAGSSGPVAAVPAEADAETEAEAETEVPTPAQSHVVAEPSPGDPQAEVEPENRDGSRRETRRLTWAMLVILLAVVAVVLIVVLAGSGGKGAAHTTSSVRTPASSHSALVALPGTGVTATGTVSIAGTGSARRLVIDVSGLPAPGANHYEVFLYNSIIDSEALGALSSTGRGSFRLPADAAHYGFVDISPQAAGDSIPDGASILRAASPAHRS